MVQREYYATREDGVKLYKTYSTENLYIKQVETGNIYDTAIDVESFNFHYEETDRKIEEVEDDEHQ